MLRPPTFVSLYTVLFLCLSPGESILLPIKAPIVEFRIHSNLILSPFNLITSTKTLFANKTTFTGTRAAVLSLRVLTPLEVK